MRIVGTHVRNLRFLEQEHGSAAGHVWQPTWPNVFTPGTKYWDGSNANMNGRRLTRVKASQ